MHPIEALEIAIATLETDFQSIVFDTEAQASAVALRLRRAETRLNALTGMAWRQRWRQPAEVGVMAGTRFLSKAP